MEKKKTSFNLRKVEDSFVASSSVDSILWSLNFTIPIATWIWSTVEVLISWIS